jgi:plastocyanin
MLNPLLSETSRAPGAPVETYSGSEYRVSGDLSNGKVVPANESYSLTFEKPGTYQYICGIHPGTMFGEIVVEAVTAADLPTQADIDAQANAEMEPLLAMAEQTRAAATNPDLVRQEPGANGTSIWYVPAGMTGVDPRIEIYDFFPKELTVQTGDTVIWTSTFFHQVIFHPGQPAPEFVIPTPQETGPPFLIVNPVVAFPAKPAGEYDGTALFSSGMIGLPAGALPGGTTFALTFSKAGAYEYVCGTHRPLGMKGTVTVIER